MSSNAPSFSSADLRAALVSLPGMAEWVDDVGSGIQTPDTLSFRARYAAAQRKLRHVEARPLPSSSTATAHWTPVDWARLWLLREGLEQTPDSARFAAVETVFEGGELGEQVSLLRSLAALDDPERYVEIGVSACRTNAVPVFEAIACENVYPSRYFPQLNFNQMVMKAVFLGVSLSRVVGLAQRLDHELRRMAYDYAAERVAAGRAVPNDLLLLGYAR